MKHIEKNEVSELFFKFREEGAVFQNVTEYLVREPKINEMIVTNIAGKVETKRIVDVETPLMVVKKITVGSSGETYAITLPKFKNRYSLSGKKYFADGYEWELARNNGKVEGGTYSGDTVTFEAPWGEKMILSEGDFLARPYPVDDEEDIYRIEKQEFSFSYQKIS